MLRLQVKGASSPRIESGPGPVTEKIERHHRNQDGEPGNEHERGIDLEILIRDRVGHHSAPEGSGRIIVTWSRFRRAQAIWLSERPGTGPAPARADLAAVPGSADETSSDAAIGSSQVVTQAGRRSHISTGNSRRAAGPACSSTFVFLPGRGDVRVQPRWKVCGGTAFRRR
jgi:hypothetical protein